MKNTYLDALQRLPIGVLQRDALIVVQHRELHCTVMLFSLTTRPQRAMLSAIHLWVAAGLRATTSMPWVSVKVLSTSGSLSALTSSAWNLSMIGFGVPAGARMPHQA